MKRTLVRILFVVVAISCTLQATAADEPEQGISRWQREDINVFRTKFLAVDRSFSSRARAKAAERLARMENAPAPLNATVFAVELCRIAALADNAHTQCLPSWIGRDMCRRFAALMGENSPWCNLREPDFEAPDFRSLAIAFHPFGEEFHVVRVGADHADVLGARLVAVDNRTIESMRAKLRTFAGGTPAHRDEIAARVLASPEQLHAVGLANEDDWLLYELVMPNGQRTKRKFSVPVESANPTTWRQLPPVDRAPWPFQEPEKPFRYRDAPQIDSLVVQLRQIMDTENEKIAAFLEMVEKQRERLGRRNIVLDLRANGGGNFLLARDFMISWPMRVPGRFYVLTSRQTFSAAITSIAYLKQAGADRVSIIGEAVGDRLVFFSDGLPVQLPHSGLFFLPAVVRMDYADGCRTYDDCFEAIAPPGRPTAVSLLKLPPMVQRRPLSVGTLGPDVPAPWTIDSWLRGTDPAMDAVEAMVKDSR